MKISQITKHDPSFKLCSTSAPNDDFAFETLSIAPDPQPYSLVFLRNDDSLETFQQTPIPTPAFLVAEEKTLKAIQENPSFDQLKKSFFAVGFVNNANKALCTLSHALYRERFPVDNDMIDGRQMGSASVHPTAKIAQNVFIGEFVTIEQDVVIFSGAVVMSSCHIGPRTTIFPRATLCQETTVGADCTIHHHAVLGSDPLASVKTGKGEKEALKIWPLGKTYRQRWNGN